MEMWRKKLKELMKKNNETLESFAEKIGVSHGLIGQILRGEKNPSPDNLLKMVECLEAGLSDIMSEKELKSFIFPSATDKTPIELSNFVVANKDSKFKTTILYKGDDPFKNDSRLPLLTFADAGLETLVMENQAEYVSTNYYDCFSLKVVGNAMESQHPPSFAENSVIIVNPHKIPKAGDFVIARLEGVRDAIFRQFRVEAGESYLIALNNVYKPILIDKNVKIAGVVIEQRTKLC